MEEPLILITTEQKPLQNIYCLVPATIRNLRKGKTLEIVKKYNSCQGLDDGEANTGIENKESLRQ